MVEVTTTTARAAGGFTVTVDVASRSQVTIHGLAPGVETPDAGDDTATVASAFTVSPPGARCSAEPADATVTVGPGAARTLSHDVPAGTSVDVTVTCRSGTHFATRTVRLAANPAPPAAECDDPLGTLGQGAVSRSGTLAAAGGCRSLGRFGARGSQSHYAARHTFRMAAAGWVTIDLVNAGRGRDRIDAYLLLINGTDPAGGTVLKHDDDSGRGSNSRIVRKSLAAGRYTIEATTFSRRDAGAYRPSSPITRNHQWSSPSLWPRPRGRESAKRCTYKSGQDESAVYTCRRLVKSRQYISKTDPRILAISGDSVRFGTTLKIKPGSNSAPELYEGCQSITEDYWLCDYHADLLWCRTVVDGDASRWIWSAFVDGVVVPSVCSVGLIALQYGTAAAGSGLAAVASAVTPEAIAGVIEDCRGLLRPAPPSTLEDD